MDYITTKLQTVKSYPTYQFHAFTAADKLPADSVFRICVLETLRWLRHRLNNYDSIPEELSAPEPENYADFSKDQLRSFNINVGANMDCTYIASKGVWSFRISETDTGENLGSDNERKPVNGRIFQTEISFLKHSGNVEVGVRTICSEPAECNEPCAVFRPAVVKALAENPEVGFMTEGFRLDGRPLMVTNQTELRNLERLLTSGSFDMPLAIVADSGYEQTMPQMIAAPDTTSLSFTGFGQAVFTADLKADTSKVKIDCNVLKTEKPKAEIPDKKAVLTETKTVDKKQPVLNYEKLAAKTMGFAVVCFVSEKSFSLLQNKLGIGISENEVIVLSHSNETERLRYSPATIENIGSRLKKELRAMLKRSSFSYGDVLFYSDARLADLREQRHENISLEDKLNIYKQENSQLSERNRELSQQNTDLQLNADNVRSLQKQLKTLQDEKEALNIWINNQKDQSAKKESAYRKAAEIVEFYRTKAKAAAHFPTEKDEVCDWARDCFSDNIIISQRAETALRKYSGALDTAILCDGIYYLNAYARYRRGELTNEQLAMCAESYNWEVSGCGSGALRVRRDDYEVTVDGERYLLDMHLKYGVSSQVLIRIYFCWDDKRGKIIIGYMPEHLATASQST